MFFFDQLAAKPKNLRLIVARRGG